MSSHRTKTRQASGPSSSGSENFRVHIFTLILQLGMVSGDLVLKKSLRLSPGSTGVHGN